MDYGSQLPLFRSSPAAVCVSSLCKAKPLSRGRSLDASMHADRPSRQQAGLRKRQQAAAVQGAFGSGLIGVSSLRRLFGFGLPDKQAFGSIPNPVFFHFLVGLSPQLIDFVFRSVQPQHDWLGSVSVEMFDLQLSMVKPALIILRHCTCVHQGTHLPVLEF